MNRTEAYVTTRDGELQEAGVFRVTSDMKLSSIIPEEVRDVSWIRRFHDQLQKTTHISINATRENARTHPSSLGFPNFDVPLERLWVHEHRIEGSNGHNLGYRAKVEYSLVLEQPQIIQTIRSVSQNVHNESADDP